MSASDIASKWAKRISASTEDIRRGVTQVTQAPSAAAVAKKEKFKQELLKAIEDGTWEKRLAQYGLEEWKSDMLNKGINRISSGAENAKKDVEEFMQEFLPFVQSVSNKVSAMPDTSLEDRINRMVTNVRELSKFKRT